MLKKILFIFLLLLPFQKFPSVFLGSDETAGFFIRVLNNLDEMAFVLLFLLILTFIFIKPDKYSFKLKDVSLTKALLFFLLVNIISFLINGVPIFQGAFGAYNPVKNIVVVYVFAAVHWSREDFFSLINGIKKIAILLAIVGILAEILALYNGFGVGYIVLAEAKQRLGLYRVSSLVGPGSTNYLAVYSVLAFFLIISTTASTKSAYKLLQLLGLALLIFFTFSRQGWVGFLIMALFAMPRKYRAASIVIVFLIIIMFTGMMVTSQVSYDSEHYYRAFGYYESLKILRDNPFFGIGPGMFGSLASVMFDSPVYDAWPQYYREFVFSRGGIDSFWPAIWGELGAFGFIAYSAIFTSVFIGLGRISLFFKKSGDIEMFNVGLTLKYFILALSVAAFADGFNSAFVVFTYFGLVGIYISLYMQRSILTVQEMTEVKVEKR